MSRTRKFFKEHIKPLLIIIAALMSFRSAVADWNDVPTGSMNPSIVAGDRIFVNKLAYGLKVPFTTFHLVRWDQPDRGEIVIFYSPVDGKRMVKRVVGLPGDTLELLHNRLHINGVPAQYGKLNGDVTAWMSQAQRYEFATEQVDGQTYPVMSDPRLRAMRNFGPVQVPEGHYFMLGDNRDNSADSRYIGYVPVDQIVGRSSRVVFSLDYDNGYLPRWDRFFRGI